MRERRALIVPGSGLVVRSTRFKDSESGVPLKSLDVDELRVTDLKLSWDMRLRLAASAHLFWQAPLRFDEVVMCGGAVYEGLWPLAEISKMRFCAAYDVPSESVFVVNDSLNTVEDLDGAAALLRHHDISMGTVVSNEYHLVARELAVAAGMEFVSAEDVLSGVPGYRPIVERLAVSPYVKMLKSQQKTWSRVLRVPFLGRWAYRAVASASLSHRAKLRLSDPSGLSNLID